MDALVHEFSRCGFSDELRVAWQAAMAGAAVIEPYFQSLGTADVRAKSDQAGYDLVTNADIEAEQAITHAIRQAYPAHDVLGEETFQTSDVVIGESPDLWVVDPLDGTNNFAHQLSHFGISIAYRREGATRVALILNPITGELFVAEKGLGAWRLQISSQPTITMGDTTSVATLIRCETASTDQLSDSLIGVGFYYDRGDMMRATLNAIERLFVEKIHGIRRFGTASLDLAMVGCGQFGGFFEFELSPWDYAAGKLFVEEAGGIVTTCDGGDPALRRTSILAAGRALHECLLGIVGPFLPTR